MSRAAKIPPNERQRIIRAVKRGVSHAEIARQYGVSRQYVYRIAPASERSSEPALPPGRKTESRTAKAKRERWAAVQRMRKRGMTEAAIAHALGITPSALSMWLSTNGLPAAAWWPTQRKGQSERQKALTRALDMYRGGMSIGDAAQACGVSRTALTNARRKAGIPSRWKRLDVDQMMRDYMTMTAQEVAAKHDTTVTTVNAYVSITGTRRGQWSETRRKRFSRT